MLCTQAADNATDLIIVNIMNNNQWFDIIIMVNVYIAGRCCIRVVRRGVIYSCAPDTIHVNSRGLALQCSSWLGGFVPEADDCAKKNNSIALTSA